jgi:hypothetical protein
MPHYDHFAQDLQFVVCLFAIYIGALYAWIRLWDWWHRESDEFDDRSTM